MATLTPNEAPSWTKFVTDFDRTYKLFNDNVKGLYAIGPWIKSKQPQMLAEYNQLVADANRHKVTLDKLAGVRNTVKGWLNTLGAAVGLSSLGLWPVAISVTAGIAALTAISSWIAKIISFSQRTNEMMRLEGKGLTPQQAAAVVNSQVSKPTVLGDLKWIVLIAAAAFIVPTVIKSLRNN